MSFSAVFVDFFVESSSWPETKNLHVLAQQAINETVNIANINVPEKAEVSLVLTDDAHMTKINATFKGINAPTNVLSFPQDNTDPSPNDATSEKPTLLGDIIVSYESVLKQAQNQQKMFQNHFLHLIVHGFLHICGYTHENQDDAEKMEAIEIEVLRFFNIPDPYNQNECFY